MRAITRRQRTLLVSTLQVTFDCNNKNNNNKSNYNDNNSNSIYNNTNNSSIYNNTNNQTKRAFRCLAKVSHEQELQQRRMVLKCLKIVFLRPHTGSKVTSCSQQFAG